VFCNRALQIQEFVARATYERVSFAIQTSITWVGLCVSVGSYYLVDDVVEYYGNVTRC